MDVLKKTFEGWDPTKLNEEESYLRLLLLAVAIVIMCCCYCFYFCYNTLGRSDATSEIDSLDVQEIEDIELQSLNDEATGTSRKLLTNFEDDSFTSDVNNDIDNRSDNGDDTSENISVDNRNERVIINACNTGEYSGGTFRVENVSDLNCSSKDKKDNTSNISNDSVIKSKSGEDTVDKCESMVDESDQCNVRDDESRKCNVGADSSKCDAASESSVGSRDSNTQILQSNK